MVDVYVSEDSGFESLHRFISGGLAIRCLNHSANLPNLVLIERLELPTSCLQGRRSAN